MTQQTEAWTDCLGLRNLVFRCGHAEAAIEHAADMLSRGLEPMEVEAFLREMIERYKAADRGALAKTGGAK